MKQQEVYFIKNGQHEVFFDLKYLVRKSLGIAVTPKSETQVTAPAGLSTIYFSPDVIRLSSHCIEYVIIDEFCHLKFSGHSAEYCHFLENVMPEWKMREKDLNA